MPPSADENTLIRQTLKWLRGAVIAHGLCPFAQREYDNERIHYAVIDAADIESQMQALLAHCAALDGDAGRETSLLIVPDGLSDFKDYLDALDLGTALLAQQGYEGVYQLASFHPHYRFAGAPPDDPSNYTNRSPYPMFHILREASVTAAVRAYPNAEKIPERNIQLTQKLGLRFMKDLLASSYE